MLVIGIIGPKASGKETVAKYIANKYHGKEHSHSEILDDVLAQLGLPNTRVNEIKLVALRKVFGANVLTGALNKKIREERAPVEVVTGIRFESELENIRNYTNSKIIYIDAPLRLRYQRQRAREQKADDQVTTFEQFEALEHKETEVHINALGEKADYRIENSGSEQELYAKVDEILKALQ